MAGTSPATDASGGRARRGRFITLEGGEGTGKTTQAKLLAETLRQRGIEVQLTREPGGAPGAEAIRALLLQGTLDRWDAATETLLHFAARRDHIVRMIGPALEEGHWVVCDRFVDSTRAYQGYGHGIDQGWIDTLFRRVAEGLVPDLTVVLDIPVEQGLERAGRRAAGADRYESLDLGFHDRVRRGFLAIVRAEPNRCIVLDARPDIDAVHRELAFAVRGRLLERAEG